MNSLFLPFRFFGEGFWDENRRYTCAAVYTYGKPRGSARGEAGLARKHRRKSLEMSAADKVSCVNALNRTYLMTGSAARALLIVDGGEVVFNLDRSLGAGFFTLSAGDTAVRADLTHLGALIVA